MVDAINQRFTGEHQRLRGTLVELMARVPTATEVALAERFATLRRGFFTHLRLEEELIFPRVVEAFPGEIAATTMSLRREHVLMHDLLVEVERGLSVPERPGVVANLSELERAMSLHYGKARRELVPLVSRLVDANPTFLRSLDEEWAG